MKLTPKLFKIYFFVAIIAILSICPFALAGIQSPILPGADFDSSVACPDNILGFQLGTQAATHQQMTDCIKAIAKTSDRVKLFELTKTYEQRPLYYLIITSPKNHKNIDKIKAQNSKLANPAKLKNAAEAKPIIKNNPAIAYLNYGIHGDELSSSDAAIYVIYHLAASNDDLTKKLLDDLVIIIDPMTNPDGRMRFLGQIRQMTGLVKNPDVQSMQHTALWSRGRGNHYFADMNRDWLMLMHPEVKASAKLIHEFSPQLLVDAHEMGPQDTYLFEPPNDPVNKYLPETIMKWRKKFSADQANAFDKNQFSYYTKDWYSDWGPMYTNAWANLQGCIGILYEQARTNSASVKQPTGNILNYSDTVTHHIVSSFANLTTLLENKTEILTDYYNSRANAIKKQPADKTFIIPPSTDKTKFNKFVSLLRDQGFEVKFAQKSFTIKTGADNFQNKLTQQKVPAGAAIIDPAQPLREMVMTLLLPEIKLSDEDLKTERVELENRRGTLLYDTTTWSLPLCFGLKAYTADQCTSLVTSVIPPKDNTSNAGLADKDVTGYLLDFQDSQIYPILVTLFDNNCHPRIAIKPFTLNNQKYPPGTVLLRLNENPKNLQDIISEIDKTHSLKITAMKSTLADDGPDPGSRKFQLIHEPRIAIASQWPISAGSFGAQWFSLDRIAGVKTSPINIQSIGYTDLRKYNVLVLPDGRLNSVLDEGALRRLRQWVSDGGTIIATGSSASFFTDEQKGFSSVRLRRDVLDKLDIYAEAVQKERDAQNVTIDPDLVWNGPDPEKQPQNQKDTNSNGPKPGIEQAKRDDQYNRMFSPHGVFLLAHNNPDQWLTFGLEEQMPILLSSGTVFMSDASANTPTRFAAAPDIRLSGLLWPEARKRIADSAYVTVERIGNGQIVLFATDPTYRLWLYSQNRLFLNACIIGTGMGTNPPTPW